MLYDNNGVPVRFGLGNTSAKINAKRKSSDDIGYTKVKITPEMVGHEIAVFTSIEYKAPGFKVKAVYPEKSRESKQLVWIDMVKKAGGIGGFASNQEQFDDIMNEFYARFYG